MLHVLYLLFIFITDALELQVPKYILQRDNFTVTCSASTPLSIMVKYCNIISRSSQPRKNGGDKFSLVFLVVHMHVEKECEVTCRTREQKVTKKISVIGKGHSYTHADQ